MNGVPPHSTVHTATPRGDRGGLEGLTASFCPMPGNDAASSGVCIRPWEDSCRAVTRVGTDHAERLRRAQCSTKLTTPH